MKSKYFFKFLTLIALTVSFVSCAGATDTLEDNQSETTQKTTVEAKTTENNAMLYY